jgi:adenine phosphoribosyltransferase
MTNMDRLKTRIRHVPDFPKAGILFYDITTLLQDPEGFRLAVDCLALPFQPESDGMDEKIDLVVGIESRGFIFGGAVADRIGAGFSPVRKPGKLPSATVKSTYTLEYGSDSLEMHADAVSHGQRVLIVDDLLATGGTARATVELVKQLGGRVHAAAFLIELVSLNGRSKLAGENVHSVLKY